MGVREPPGGPEGVRSTERSEPRKVATRSVAKGHAQSILRIFYKIDRIAHTKVLRVCIYLKNYMVNYL
jgi:hypothetical protein